jgi:hypothetical protein
MSRPSSEWYDYIRFAILADKFLKVCDLIEVAYESKIITSEI